MDAESTQQTQDTKSSALRWFLAPVIIVLIYILSSGPAYRLARVGAVPRTLVNTVYRPLDALCTAHVTTLHAYSWYLGLWGVHILPSKWES